MTSTANLNEVLPEIQTIIHEKMVAPLRKYQKESFLLLQDNQIVKWATFTRPIYQFVRIDRLK